LAGGDVAYHLRQREGIARASLLSFRHATNYRTEQAQSHRGFKMPEFQTDPLPKPLGELIFGGVFDRHPKLRVVFAEFGVSWVPVFLQDAEGAYDFVQPIIDDLKCRPAKRPSYYWHNHCYATFQNDLLGLKLLDYVGADRIMWAQDYPHNEGTFGYSWTSRNDVIAATTEPFCINFHRRPCVRGVGDRHHWNHADLQ
jgi:hypothetical protein